MPGVTQTVYSTRFLALQGLSGSQSYPCPFGYRLVLRDLDAWYVGLFDNTVHLVGSSGQAIWGNGFTGGGTLNYASWRGRQIIEYGESFSVNASQPTDVTVSGYLLLLP